MSPDMTAVFHARPYGKFIEIRTTSGERNLIERFKPSIFLEAVLATEPQFNLEKTDNPSILKMIFPQKQNHPCYFTGQTKQIEFFQQVTSCPVFSFL